MSRELLYLSLLGVFLSAGILVLLAGYSAVYSSNPVPLKIESVRQVPSQGGEFDELLISGKGFDSETRVVFSADIGNQRALAGNVPLSGSANDVIIDNDFVYVANTQIGLQVLDLESPLRPTIQDTHYLGTLYSTDLCQDENRLFLTNSRQGVRVYDMTHPLQMPLLASIMVPGRPLFSQASGDRLYVATVDGGVQIIDISRPSTNKIDYRTISSIALPGKPSALVYENGILFIATVNSGVLVYDVTDHEKPALMTSIAPERHVSTILVDDHILYLGDKLGRIALYNIRNPAVPSLLGEITTGGWVTGITRKGDRLYLADNYYGLIVLNIEKPEFPQIVARIAVKGQARSVALYHGYAYIACSVNGLQLVSLDSLEDVLMDFSDRIYSGFNALDYVTQTLVDDDWIYIADSRYSLQILKRRNGKKAVMVSSLATTGRIMGFARKGNFLYLAENEEGVSVVDVSDPRYPRMVNNLRFSGKATGLAVEGDTLVVASLRTGIFRLDISTPWEPRLVETIPIEDRVRDVDISDGYLYVAAERGGVKVFKIESEQASSMLKSIDFPWPMSNFSLALAIKEQDGYLYVANGADGLLIVDVGDPEKAHVAARLDLSAGVFTSINLEGTRGYITDTRSGVHLIDISNPESPRNLGRVITLNGIHDVQTHGESLLVSAGGKGMAEILRPQELKNVVREGTRLLRVSVPRPKRGGWYSLHISNRNEQTSAHGVLSFPAH
ncbi:MAG TPA: hypothetical protein VJ974_02105 [Geopsychrobacteraceae bacterium]|nr:hypothetical protein [Geopsychrobacteraceae bacterium]